jgi:hypothetical protein
LEICEVTEITGEEISAKILGGDFIPDFDGICQDVERRRKPGRIYFTRTPKL